jgi:putative glutamine amidotransferase
MPNKTKPGRVGQRQARPRIAIPIPTSTDVPYNERSWPLYAEAVKASGGEPVAVPLESAPEEIARLVGTCEGVLLPGSPADVNPEKYGAARSEASSPADSRRELVDELLLQDAQNMRKPIFAVCYGIQSLNVWSGGTLIQDLPKTPVFHPAGATVAWAHDVLVKPDSLLAEAVADSGGKLASNDLDPAAAGVEPAAVNSSHHQAIETVGDGLQITARSLPDGVIEAVEGTRPGHFVLGTQWHPERGFDADPLSQELFRRFISAARDWHPKPTE